MHFAGAYPTDKFCKKILRFVFTIRKQNTRNSIVMGEPTTEHPAQVDIMEVDEPIGEIIFDKKIFQTDILITLIL
ncbi:MAG TPA: hypothetical protein PKK94_06260 [Leptospiraceae bacterium]|nr:hypothetical protein [Leptospiraceae bacterium]